MVTFMEAMHGLIMSRSHLISGFPPSQPIRMQSRVAPQKEQAKLEDFSFSWFLHQQNMYELEIKKPKWND